MEPITNKNEECNFNCSRWWLDNFGFVANTVSMNYIHSITGRYETMKCTAHWVSSGIHPKILNTNNYIIGLFVIVKTIMKSHIQDKLHQFWCFPLKAWNMFTCSWKVQNSQLKAIHIQLSTNQKYDLNINSFSHRKWSDNDTKQKQQILVG